MKASLIVISGMISMMALADNTVPQRPDFNRYQGMLNRSFAMATMVPTSTPDFARDLYVANVACTGKDCLVTLTSTTDTNFKKQVPVKLPDEGLKHERDFNNIYIDLRP